MRINYLIISLLVCFVTFANDGSQLWLPSADAQQSNVNVKIIGGKDKNGTLAIAKQELQRAGMESPIIFKLTKGSGDSYKIYTDKNNAAVIESPTHIGILYGVYDLVRRTSMGEDISNISIAESPAYIVRALNHWDNLDGSVERGYAGQSIWKWEELPANVSPRYEQYARACASVGINASVLNNVNASPAMLSHEYLIKVAKIADIFRPYGIKVYISANFASPQALGDVDTADPFDPAVKKWWSDKAKEIYALIPDFGGFLVKANSEGRPGPNDFGRTHADGANMLADALKPYGGIVMWRSFVYNPSANDRAMQAYNEFVPFDGHFRDNVIIQIKNGPIDFQPREPFNPLFGALPHTQQMIEFQITQEYMGAANHLFFQAPLWKECLDSETGRQQPNANVGTTVAEITAAPLHGVSAIAGVANIGDDTNWTGHLFGQANWYAFGRLAWNPSLDAQNIAEEWLRQTFCNDDEFVQPMTSLMVDSREAVTNYMMPIGLHHIFAENHHYGPQPWHDNPDIRPDWTAKYYHKGDALGIGFDRTIATGSGATSQYAEPWQSRFEHLETCPVEYLLWFHHVDWEQPLSTGRTLWQELCYRYDSGVQTARQFQKTWDNLRDYVDPEAFEHVARKLSIQTHDAQWWKDACLLYFQSLNGLPFPADMERPVYNLDDLKTFRIPIGICGNPQRSILP